MHYVYILVSLSTSQQRYIGTTSDLEIRLKEHNSGKSTHTSKFIPWEIECYFAFKDKKKAYDFEKYLKSHSGRAFAKKRFFNEGMNKIIL
jgi:predicted GIY-YIG superfamily endonuclease